LLDCAVRVPDHGKLVPWRFLSIQGKARQQLGDLLAARSLERNPQAAAAVVEKDRLRFSHAPLIVAVIARLTPGHKVPEQEQLLSGGAVCLQLLQAADAMGFGAQWLTGWAAYDPFIRSRLGLGENECILGFIHIGTASEAVVERERPDPRLLLTELRL
jgi:nitroreductase